MFLKSKDFRNLNFYILFWTYKTSIVTSTSFKFARLIQNSNYFIKMNLKLSTFIVFLLWGIDLFAQKIDAQSWLFFNIDYKMSEKNIVALQLWDRNYYSEDYK